jgi:hypothetical protein
MGQVMNCRFGREATITMYGECCAVAEKSGSPISPITKDRALNVLLDRIKFNYLDVERF